MHRIIEECEKFAYAMFSFLKYFLFLMDTTLDLDIHESLGFGGQTKEETVRQGIGGRKGPIMHLKIDATALRGIKAQRYFIFNSTK